MYPKAPEAVYTEHWARIASTNGRIASYKANMTLLLLGFCDVMTPHRRVFFVFLKIDCFPPCIKPPSHPIAEANFFFLKSIVSLLA